MSEAAQRLERLNELRSGRGKASFGRAIGIEARQYISRVFEEGKSKDLSPQDLKMLCLAENVNLGWYITGLGSKYTVYHHHTTNEFQLIAEGLVTEYESFWMLADKDSDDTEQRQVILVALKEVDTYSEISIHVGQPNISLISMFEPQSIKGHLVPTADFESIARGEFGTFKLLGGERKEGYLANQDDIPLDWIVGNLPKGTHLEVNDLPALFKAYEETKASLQRVSGGSTTAEATVADMAMALFRSTKNTSKP